MVSAFHALDPLPTPKWICILSSARGVLDGPARGLPSVSLSISIGLFLVPNPFIGVSPVLETVIAAKLFLDRLGAVETGLYRRT